MCKLWKTQKEETIRIQKDKIIDDEEKEDDEGNIQGGYDSCTVYGYASVLIQKPSGPEGINVTLGFAYIGSARVGARFVTDETGYKENIYLGSLVLEKNTTYNAATIYMNCYKDSVRKTGWGGGSRSITYEEASNNGTQSEYTWIEKFEISFDDD